MELIAHPSIYKPPIVVLVITWSQWTETDFLQQLIRELKARTILRTNGQCTKYTVKADIVKSLNTLYS